MRVRLTLEVQITAPSIEIPKLTELLGLQPTLSWRDGDAVGGSPIMKRKGDGWVRRIPTTDVMHAATDLEALVREWSPRSGVLREWVEANHGSAVVRCRVTTLDGSVPAIRLDHSLLLGLSALGVDLDIDVLCPAPEEE